MFFRLNPLARLCLTSWLFLCVQEWLIKGCLHSVSSGECAPSVPGHILAGLSTFESPQCELQSHPAFCIFETLMRSSQSCPNNEFPVPFPNRVLSSLQELVETPVGIQLNRVLSPGSPVSTSLKSTTGSPNL